MKFPHGQLSRTDGDVVSPFVFVNSTLIGVERSTPASASPPATPRGLDTATPPSPLVLPGAGGTQRGRFHTHRFAAHLVPCRTGQPPIQFTRKQLSSIALGVVVVIIVSPNQICARTINVIFPRGFAAAVHAYHAESLDPVHRLASENRTISPVLS